MAISNTNSPANDDIAVPMCAIFRRFLKRQGLKFTNERALILNAVLDKQGVFEAEQLLHELRSADHRVSKATIYRTLKHLLEAGIISEVLIDAHRAHYELTYGQSPRGHLVCAETDQIIEFDSAELTELAQRICTEHGYQLLSHRFVIYGRSAEARQDEAAE